MYDRILLRARNLVQSSRYYMTHHGQMAIYERGLNLIEVENAILNGSIIERQKDIKTGESKYRILGSTMGGEVELVVKFAPDGRLAIITVYPI